MTDPIRLAKRLAEIVPCSRREAELYIEGGWVTVDGRVVEEPQFKVSQQKIELDPKAVLTPIEPVTILFHGSVSDATAIDVGTAPANISADTHATDDQSGIQPLKRHFTQLTMPLPIQALASGLLVLTQDWRVTRKLVDDVATVEQEYIVEVAGKLSTHGLKQLNQGLTFNAQMLPTAKVSWQNETRLRFAIKNPQSGQITHMCQSVGLQVLSMKRIRIGKVSMSKLAVRQWRYLPFAERF